MYGGDMELVASQTWDFVSKYRGNAISKELALDM
jgi:hypothetical protein